MSELGKLNRKYKKYILKYSVEKQDFIKAMEEWELIGDYRTDDILLLNAKKYNNECPSCICSHPISKAYLIRNKLNLTELVNGCDCIKKIDGTMIKEQTENYIKKKKSIKKIIEQEENTRFNNSIEKIFDDYKNKMEQLFLTEKNNIVNFVNKCNNKNINFGKYKGKPYSIIPKQYIKWYGSKRKEDKSTFFKNNTLDDIYKFCFDEKIKSDSDSD